MSEIVEWKPVVGYEGLYEISSLGDLRSWYGAKKSCRMIKTHLTNRGYPACTLCKDLIKTRKHNHRMVAEAFHTRDNETFCVDHIDRNRENNNVGNLRWVTASQNQKNSGIRRTNKSGEKNIYWSEPIKRWVIDTRTNGVRKSTKRRTFGEAILKRDQINDLLQPV